MAGDEFGNKDPKNPWGGGDEREKLLGPDAVREIRERVRTGRREKLRIDIEESAAVHDASRDKPHRVRMEAAVRKNFRDELEDAGGLLNYTYKLGPSGVVEMSDDLVAVDNGRALLLANCAEAVYDVSKPLGHGTVGWTQEALKAAANRIMGEYPEIKIDCIENPTEETFTWRATLEKK